MSLNVESVLGILNQGGPLTPYLKGFEPRAQQNAMMRNVIEAFNQKKICLIEAGTGTGKSLAYLIPALLWAVEFKERIVISTHTIPLQEQLLNKDIPAIAKALQLNFQAVIVKGMQNYLCLKKFAEVEQEVLLLSPKEVLEWQNIVAWKEQTQEGSRSCIPFQLSSNVWDKIAAESDLCSRNACPFFQKCHFFKARQTAQQAQILIVNHHLLFSDLVSRSENEQSKESGILPQYSRIILDEAHHIEDIATEYFASTISQLDIMRTMARLLSDKSGKVLGSLPRLKEKFSEHYRNGLGRSAAVVHQRLTIDLPGLRHDLTQQTHETFGAFYAFVETIQEGRLPQSKDESLQIENKLRLLPQHQLQEVWKTRLTFAAALLVASLKRFSEALTALISDIKYLNNSQFEEQNKGTLFDINSLRLRLDQYADLMSHFMSDLTDHNKVRWIQTQNLKSMISTALVDANLDISNILVEHLFSKFSTLIMCSATLTANKEFDFFKKRLGLTQKQLPNRKVEAHIYASPFDYKKQQLFLVPMDLPEPSHPQFIAAASETISQAVQSSRGNAFILFTSNAMLNACYKLLETRLSDARLMPLKQGEGDRKQLLDKFKKTTHSVLFATNSFWEGIDVSGDALRCVIIVKLPFKVPSDPLIQARSERIYKEGGDPFLEYLLPQAIVKFKQGCGRLIRAQADRGCVVCLDNRIFNKSYGKLFLDSLPDCQKLFVKQVELQQVMNDFYRRTHFLVNRP